METSLYAGFPTHSCWSEDRNCRRRRLAAKTGVLPAPLERGRTVTDSFANRSSDLRESPADRKEKTIFDRFPIGRNGPHSPATCADTAIQPIGAM